LVPFCSTIPQTDGPERENKLWNNSKNAHPPLAQSQGHKTSQIIGENMALNDINRMSEPEDMKTIIETQSYLFSLGEYFQM
jgi:hypothetical protein